MAKQSDWKLVEWDGNQKLGLKCWEKKFGKGVVSVGVGDEFLTVCYSHGANSDDSISSTRWHYGDIISEQDMMDFVDSNNGKCKPYPKKPGQYRDWFNKQTKQVQDALLGVGRPWYDMCMQKHLADMAI